ncbi:PAS domain S-box protein [Geobacter sp. FeAm09]|uniref:PAS domain-containing sensor histidine kinase n=1 Tax=Geobacter sp. FeAm09 TaxID=2597769 RepID=UPI0011ED7746|nr:PAS domain-containing sensor histidine kinase [Geobacter sp. FeAm09]QEM68735.1 PAS domain S-box protein [Geobacter sp. FeAm09]
MSENIKEDIALLQELLRDSDEKFRLLYESEPFVYDSLDENGIILEVSQGWLNLLGYTREEVIGHWLGEFYTPEYREDFSRHWQLTKDSGIVDNVYVKLARKDGTVIDAVIYARLRYDNNGNLVRTHCITHDISEQKKANEALKRSEYEKALILEVMSDAIIFRDTRMKVLWANRNAAAPFNMTPEQMIGTYCFREAHGRETPCDGCIIAKTLRTGQPETGERSNGTNTYIVRGYPVRDAVGDLIGVVHVAHDITERRRLERELLERSALEQQKFGRDLHDGLGQMLTGIAFIARALQEQLETRALPEAVDAAKLEEIAERALLVTHRLAKGLDPVGLDTESFLTAVSELALTTETLFGAVCTFRHDDVPGSLEKDVPIHLYYIIQEAINNAIKHGRAKSIGVTIRCLDGQLLLTICDDGSGLPATVQSKGMGLQTMKYRASTLGGCLMLHNNDRGGVTLTCSLPLQRVSVP